MAHRVDPGFRIPVPHSTSRIILTPPNIADGRDVVAALNDPRVYMNLNGPPYPYTDEDYLGWYEVIEEAARTSSEEMQTIKRSSNIASDTEQNAGGCQRKWMGRSWWVSAIRELRSERSESGEEMKFLGETTVRRSNFLYITDEAERHNKVDENNSLEAGDPKILWEVGFYLIPECHGRGIMPMVLQTLISEILIPYFNLQRLEGTYFEHNVPSRKVFEKCGFEFVTVVPDAITLAPAKTGRLEGVKVGMGVMTWQRQPTI
ncbi:hypothetical protein LTS15_005917 [Exophiala xenobiotica]|nr:hypothetical protein LTS15_005917 [Exophiala xenobiotica]